MEISSNTQNAKMTNTYDQQKKKKKEKKKEKKEKQEEDFIQHMEFRSKTPMKEKEKSLILRVIHFLFQVRGRGGKKKGKKKEKKKKK
jgi:hypothetical protein